MKKLIVIIIDGYRYGIWKDDVLAVREVSTVYGLPESPDWFAGIARIDDRTAHLMDIATIIGHRPFDRNRPGCVLIMSDGRSIEGFIADSEESRLDVPDGSTFPMPGYMACYGIDTFVLHGSELLPIIKIKDVYEQLRSEHMPLPVCTVNMGTLPRLSEKMSHDFWMFTIRGENYAVRGDLIERSDTCSPSVSSLPSAPDYVEGVVYDSGGVRAIIDPGKRIGYEGCDEGVVVFVKQGGPGFRVGADARTFSGCTPVLLPPLASSELMQYALLNEQDIVPVLDVHALVSVDTQYRKKTYTPRSRFHHHFGTKAVSVLEFTLSDMVLGLPDSQVEDILDAVPFRSFRDLHPLLLGVAERNGDLLPVLSLSPCFTRTALPAKDSKMILLKNGNFRVLLIVEKVLDRRSLLPSEQKALPINLPYRYVYGCYTDENSVRLILDVATIAMHAGESKVREDIKTLMDKLLRTDSREAEKTVQIARYNTDGEDQTTIPHTEDDADLPETINIGNDQLPVIEERVIVRSINIDIPVATDMNDDKEGLAESTADDRKGKYTTTQENGHDEFDEDHEIIETHDDQEVSEDVLEKKNPEKRVTGTIETDNGLEERTVDDERFVKIEARSTDMSNTTGTDIGENRLTRRDYENTMSEKEHCKDPDRDVAVSERENEKKFRAGESDPVNPHHTYAGDEKKEKEGLPLSVEVKTVRKRDRSDVSDRIVTGTTTSLDDIDKIEPRKSSGSVKLSYAKYESVKSRTERSGKGSYAILALGICTMLMVLLTYFFLVPSNNDVTTVSERGDRQAATLKETTNPNGLETAFSTVDDISHDKMNTVAADNSSVKSVSETYDAASGTTQGNDNDIMNTSALTVEHGNESSASGVIIETEAYVVKKGDTLWDIAEHFTGDPFNYKTIAVDNDIQNPDLIFPGQKILIQMEVAEDSPPHTNASP